MGELLSNQLFLLFVIIGIGYLVGSIKVKEINFGAAGILLVAMVFGHFGYELVAAVQNIGIACFVTAVGLIAGPSFFQNFKGKARVYVFTGAVIVCSGFLACAIILCLSGMSVDLAIGLLAGALTTTPGLAAAIEATGSDMVSVGYGIAYPFGVISVVLFVQLIPKMIQTDSDMGSVHVGGTIEDNLCHKTLIEIDSYGLFSFALAIVIGFLIGQIKIPLIGGGTFSLGVSGGPLFSGIILGNLQSIGNVDIRIKRETLGTMRELGLAFFLAGAGTHAGIGFVETLLDKGLILFVYGVVMAIVPIVLGYVFARKVFKLQVLDTLGTICGGMTSTPALGTLINSTGTDDVTIPYAATYPIALTLIVVLMEIVGGMV